MIFDPCKVLWKSYCLCTLHLEVAKENWWARLPYYRYKAQNQHTRRCNWIHQKSFCMDSWTRPYLRIAFSWTILFFSLGVFLTGLSLFQRHLSWGSSWWLLEQKLTSNFFLCLLTCTDIMFKRCLVSRRMEMVCYQ